MNRKPINTEICKVKNLNEDDVEAVYLLETENFSQAWTQAQIRKAIQSKNFLFLGIFDKDILVAYLFAQCFPSIEKLNMGECEIINIATTSKHRRKGLAEALLNYLISFVNQKQADSILLEVRESNFPAFNLYSKLGFKIVGRRKNYYPPLLSENKEEKNEDAIIMKFICIK